MPRTERVSPVTADPLVSVDVATPCDLTMTKWLRALASRSRHRARRSGFLHDLPNDAGERLFQRQIGLCAISGLPFSLAEFVDVLVKHPFAPSLDRIPPGADTPRRTYKPCPKPNRMLTSYTKVGGLLCQSCRRS